MSILRSPDILISVWIADPEEGVKKSFAMMASKIFGHCTVEGPEEN